MTEAEQERAAVVAWLRQFSDGKIGWRDRVFYAWLALKRPNAVVDAAMWVAANAIEAQAHLSKGSE